MTERMKRIRNCGDCPHFQIESVGTRERSAFTRYIPRRKVCEVTGNDTIVNGVSDWCPLEFAPPRTDAEAFEEMLGKGQLAGVRRL